MSDRDTQQSGTDCQQNTQQTSSTSESAAQTANFGIGGTAANLRATLSSGEEARKRRLQQPQSGSQGNEKKGET